MTEGTVKDGKVFCPLCNSGDYTVYRRERDEDEAVVCLARCRNCDATFSFRVDRYDVPVPKEDDSPRLPFEED